MHAVVLLCWVGFLIGISVFTTRIWVSLCDSGVFGFSKRDSGVSMRAARTLGRS